VNQSLFLKLGYRLPKKKCHSCEGILLTESNLACFLFLPSIKNKKRWKKSAPNISIVGASLAVALKKLSFLRRQEISPQYFLPRPKTAKAVIDPPTRGG